MQTDEKKISARVVIGYGEKRFSVFANEITTFLINCEKIGLPNIQAITNDLEDISDLIIDSDIKDADALKRQLKLIRELTLLLKGAIFEEL